MVGIRGDSSKRRKLQLSDVDFDPCPLDYFTLTTHRMRAALCASVDACGRLAADLRQRAQSTDAHLQQRVLAGLLVERPTEMGRQRLPGAQRRPQIDLVIAKQTRAQASVRREAYAITRAAVRVRHRRDHTDRSGGASQAVVRR